MCFAANASHMAELWPVSYKWIPGVVSFLNKKVKTFSSFNVPLLPALNGDVMSGVVADNCNYAALRRKRLRAGGQS